MVTTLPRPPTAAVLACHLNMLLSSSSPGRAGLLAHKTHADSCSQELFQCTYPTLITLSATSNAPGSKSSINSYRKYLKGPEHDNFAEWDRLAGRRDVIC